MFEAINNADMNIFQVDEWIKRTRDANNGIISPDFAMKILGKTNHRGHIKTVIKNIKDRCKTWGEILPYRGFILSCVDERKMSEQAIANLREMAIVCGCVEEFNKLNAKTKFYSELDYEGVTLYSDSRLADLVEDKKDIQVYLYANDIKIEGVNISDIKLKFKDNAEVAIYNSKIPEDLDFSKCSKVFLSGCDFRDVKNFNFRDGIEVKLREAKNLPEVLDFSMCSKVKLSDCNLMGLKELKFREGADVCLSLSYLLPQDLDVSMCSKVDLCYCDLEGLSLKFREGAEVGLIGAKNLPSDLDVSMCSSVNLGYCDLIDLGELKFRDGAEVDLIRAKNLPSDLDVSMCSKVSLSCCDLMGLKELKFRDGAEVNLRGFKKLPEDLDVSMCSKVDLSCCDLMGLKELKFREGAEVSLVEAKNLPEVLDFSMCSKVDCKECNLSGVKKLKFRDENQKNKFLYCARKFSGEVVYVGDEEKSKTVAVSKSGGMDM